MYLPQSENFLDKRGHFAGKKAIKVYTNDIKRKSRKNLEKGIRFHESFARIQSVRPDLRIPYASILTRRLVYVVSVPPST